MTSLGRLSLTSLILIASSFLIFLMTSAPSVKPSGKIFSSFDFFEVISFPRAQKPPSPSSFSPTFKSFFA